MDFRLITYERRDDVALLTLNRPERLNAWTPSMAVEQAAAIEEANADPAVGAIGMTGAGRGFCAGADVDETFKSRRGGVGPGEDPEGGAGGGGRAPAPIEAAHRGRERGGRRHRDDDDPAVRRHPRLGARPLRHALHQGGARPRAREHALPGAARGLRTRE